MNLSLLRRICGPTKEQRKNRAQADADATASAIERARMKAKAAIEEQERRRRTDTAIHDMKRATAAATAVTLGIGGLTAQEVALLPDEERERFLRAMQPSNGNLVGRKSGDQE